MTHKQQPVWIKDYPISIYNGREIWAVTATNAAGFKIKGVARFNNNELIYVSKIEVCSASDCEVLERDYTGCSSDEDRTDAATGFDD
jgi:hypothetical protein